MERKKFKFDVNTFSNCFICFDEIVEELKNEREFFPLQNVLQYLQIALRNIESFSKKSETLLNRTEIRVRLCKDCGRTIKTFTELYKTLKLTKLKLNCTAGVIQTKLMNSDKAESNRLNDYQLKLESSSDLKVLRHFKLAKELRNEIVEKCEQAVAVSQPTVKLLKLNNSEIQKLTTRSLRKESTSKVASEFQGTVESLPFIESFEAVVTKQEIEEDEGNYNDIEVEGINQDEFYDNSGIENLSIPSNEIECKPEIDFTLLGATSQQKKSKSVHRQATYECERCQITFSHFKWLEVHKETCDVSDSRLNAQIVYEKFQKILQSIGRKPNQEYRKNLEGFKCPEPSCSQKFIRKRSAQKHYKLSHMELLDKCRKPLSEYKPEVENVSTLPAATSKQKTTLYGKTTELFKCRGPTCSKQLKTKESLKSHHYRHRQSQIKLSPSFKCPNQTCPSEFCDAASAKIHFDSVHRQTRYKCDLCQVKFSQRDWLEQHKKECTVSQNAQNVKLVYEKLQKISQSLGRKPTEEEDPTKFNCPEPTCSLKFNWKASAQNHYKSVHLKGSYECGKCQKKFNHPKTFSNHKAVCQGKKNNNTCEDTSGSNKDPLRKRERKFKCAESTCVRTFFQRTAAIKHYQTVHLKKYVLNAKTAAFAHSTPFNPFSFIN